MKSCLKFRQIFINIGQIDPLVESMTIASACNKYYRKHHLPINQIAVIPHGGYRKEERQSIIALKWLKWISHRTGERIQHKVGKSAYQFFQMQNAISFQLNGGEATVGPWRVDGLCGKRIYEFMGCYWVSTTELQKVFIRIVLVLSSMGVNFA